MFREVRPSLYLWSYLGFFASWAWLFSCLKMDFLNKSTGVVIILVRLTIIFSWFVLRVLLQKDFLYFLGQSADDRLFRRYERLGKTVGSALLFFGNIGLYYYSEKSIACMLTFLFLALYCLCALFCIQPYTDFGVLEFLLGASLNQGLCLFGIHSCSFWFVLIACIVVVGQSADDRLFRGYERLGKTVGSAFLFFENIGLYYYSEKSIACMLTFLFLALYCLCALFCIQSYTDFGGLEFPLGVSLNRGLCLLGFIAAPFGLF
ncbi:hypothetical protein LOK49_LG12G01763 [Camellia lanceoleosa]|uniref:Uncharacterized protein n=1 Tax=Camellia lanceoleosa TaxID=1840588 RepID=A0ACC0FR57_9ERIC|nr:hypothetical protein LOK49_LG12G01763 [Camellia lanceoleosa]